MGRSVEPPFTVAIADRYNAIADRYNAIRPSKGIWRIRARNAIVEVIFEVCADLGTTPITRKEALAFIDDAYPFGERAMAPYKAWLAERKLFVAAFDEPPRVPDGLPTSEDVAACEVAADLVEMGRVDDAVQLLAEQAPRRLALRCPACDVAPTFPCFDVSTHDDHHKATVQIFRVVPHTARLRPPSGPLFSQEATP